MTRLFSKRSEGDTQSSFHFVFPPHFRHCVKKKHIIAAHDRSPTPSFDSSASASTHTKSLVHGTFTSTRAVVETSREEQALAFSARRVQDRDRVEGIVAESHADYYSYLEHMNILEKGGVLFSFSCPSVPLEAEHDASLVETIANLSSFTDETTENFVPRYERATQTDYTYVISRCSYLLPDVDIEELCQPEYLATSAYHKACQPNGTKVWDDDENNNTTFRITKPIIPYLFKLTVQFKVSRISEEDIRKLSILVGTKVDCGLLLERTKRHAERQDSTRKTKSVLLYTTIDGGILVNHVTVILQSSLPYVIAVAIHKFGTWGLGEARETVAKTRAYTKRTIPMSHA